VSTTARLIVVTNCGNKFELLSQLNDIGRVSKDARPTFRLTIEHPDSEEEIGLKSNVDVHINGIEASSGYGDRWIISGVMPNFGVYQRNSYWVHKEFLSSRGAFCGDINIRSRTGYIHPTLGVL
jgi:hypothetical protein